MKKITEWIGNLSINTKLGMIMGLPLIGMLALAVILGGRDWGQMHRLDLMEQSVALSVSVGNLVHEMQKERGASAGFIGSQGSKFGTILQSQRRETDRAYDRLKGLFGDFDMDALTEEGAEAIRAYMRSMEAWPASAPRWTVWASGPRMRWPGTPTETMRGCMWSPRACMPPTIRS